MSITVSDIRESILRNLRHRFRQAGIEKYHAFIADLSKDVPPASGNAPPASGSPAQANGKVGGFDLILADVPCTGSGTWSRNPEELWFFDPEQILQYRETQKKILTHLVPGMAPNAWFVYSTCSVFKKENEEMAVFLRNQFDLQQNKMENIKGYDQGADTMFAANFHR